MSSQQPLRIQLAIQGGGAKICVLLAAMEAVQSLQADKKIEVTRVAGTSAGAIVACLFAAGINMKTVKEHLKGLTTQQLAQYFPQPTMKKAVYRLGWHGKPLWEKTFLEGELEGLFNKAGFYKLGDLKLRAHVVAANLVESRPVVYGEPEKDIVSALLDSCGLPYCFRVWDKNNTGNPVIVDGGICENLPSEQLEPFQAEDGPVVGISFSPTRRKSVSTVWDFTGAILDTAINNSMNRAKRRLGTDRVHEIQTDIGTFDFAKALRYLREQSGNYELVKERADKWFNAFVEARRKTAAGEQVKQVVDKDTWKEQSVSTMEKLSTIYRTQHLVSKFKYTLSSLMVQANCLVTDPQNTFYGKPDFVSYSLTFQTLDKEIYCHAFALSEAEHDTDPSRTEFLLLDLTKPKGAVKTVSMPMRDPDKPTRKELLLHFIPPLPPQSGPYKLECKDVVRGFMKNLAEKKRDDLYITSLRAQGKIDRIDLVLFVPNTAGGLRLVAREGSPPGEPMSELELSKYNVPPGFRAVGWTGVKVDPEPDFGADIFLSDGT
ncbi:MAG: patatin-like phospholipase family protein [Acidobacteria bacterium]|nr:patatin-like phospholipase family protein [Acidobacteriota bacterium]